MAAEPGGLPRVLFVIGSLEAGGSEGQLVTLLERVHGQRVDAVVAALVPARDQRLTRRLEAAGVPVRILGPQRNRLARLAASLWSMARLLRRPRPDLVYPWLEQSALIVAPLARLARIPVLVGRRNVSGPYAERPRAIVAAIHAAERTALLATANSRAVAAETVRRGIPESRVRVIPNGFVGTTGAALPCRDVVTLGYLARMRPEKGHRRLLDALAGMSTEEPWRVELAGDGPLQAELEAEVEQLGLADRVTFAGPVDDPAAFWSGCDAALLLSDHEGSPNALIEAAAAGRPLVATAVGGVPEFVDDTVGLLVDPGDRAGLVAALERIVTDRGLRERLGAAAATRAAERFSVETFVDGHCAAINEALELAHA